MDKYEAENKANGAMNKERELDVAMEVLLRPLVEANANHKGLTWDEINDIIREWDNQRWYRMRKQQT